MDTFGKVFKRIDGNSVYVNYIDYNPDMYSYTEFIRKARKNKNTQVIINAEIMLNIITHVLKCQGVVMKVSFSDPIDDDIDISANNILKRIRDGKNDIETLKKELYWMLERDSIDLSSVVTFIDGEKYTIYSNGIFEGRNIEHFFNKILEPVLEKYLNA